MTSPPSSNPSSPLVTRPPSAGVRDQSDTESGTSRTRSPGPVGHGVRESGTSRTPSPGVRGQSDTEFGSPGPVGHGVREFGVSRTRSLRVRGQSGTAARRSSAGEWPPTPITGQLGVTQEKCQPDWGVTFWSDGRRTRTAVTGGRRRHPGLYPLNPPYAASVGGQTDGGGRRTASPPARAR